MPYQLQFTSMLKSLKKSNCQQEICFSLSHLTPSIKIKFDNFFLIFFFFFGSLIRSCETVCHLTLFFLLAFSFNCFTHECSLSVFHVAYIWFVMLKEITFCSNSDTQIVFFLSSLFIYFVFASFGILQGVITF